jgi:hypothetical protein
MQVERGGKFKERARLGIRFHTLVLADGTIARIPLWMIDATVCAEHSIGIPEVSVPALMDLRQLLDALDQTQGDNAQPNARPLEVEHEQSTLSNPSSASAVGDGGRDGSITSDSHE